MRLALLAGAALVASLTSAAEPRPAVAPSGANLVSAGPMAGFADANEARLWVQTTAAARVQIRYWPEGRSREARVTAVVQTSKPTAYTAHLVADHVEPGTRYAYELLVDGSVVPLGRTLRFSTPPLWRWHTDPPDVTIALGSCAYINDPPCDRSGPPYGGEYGIFDAIAGTTPDLMLWIGDNVYLRECDWTSRAGILRRYTASRRLPELQKLMGATNHVAIWDDHDYGPNDSDRGFILKDQSLEAFRLFWDNPSYGVPGIGGITTTFEWSDVQLFLLDGRYFRAPDGRRTGERTMLGRAQFEWLLDALARSEATFKLVVLGGQVLNPVARFETYAHNFPQERDALLQAIRDEGIDGVVFLTGDRHFSSLSKLDRKGTYPLYDFTVSPLTSGPAKDLGTEPNPLVVTGSVCTKRNFATLHFTGPPASRHVVMTLFDSAGRQQWQTTLGAADLKAPKPAPAPVP